MNRDTVIGTPSNQRVNLSVGLGPQVIAGVTPEKVLREWDATNGSLQPDA